MAAAKKRIASKAPGNVVPMKFPPAPPAESLSRFFEWLNERYGLHLPLLASCPSGTVLRDLLSQEIAFESPPPGIKYQARIKGKVAVVDTLVLRNLVFQFRETRRVDTQYGVPSVTRLHGPRSLKRTTKKEKRHG